MPLTVAVSGMEYERQPTTGEWLMRENRDTPFIAPEFWPFLDHILELEAASEDAGGEWPQIRVAGAKIRFPNGTTLSGVKIVDGVLFGRFESPDPRST